MDQEPKDEDVQPVPELPLGSEIQNELDHIYDIYKKFAEKDATLSRHDTTEIVVDLLAKTQEQLRRILDAGEQAREKLFWVLFNGSVHIYEYCRHLRSASHQREAIEGLAFVISILEGDLVLMRGKYLEWRIKTYIELAGVYEDLKAPISALNVIVHGQKQIAYLKELEEQDPPVPRSTEIGIYQSQCVLNSLELKYGLQSEQLKPDAWKKKLEEYYSVDKPFMALAIIESLNSSVSNTDSIIGNKKVIKPWKSEAIKYALELLEPDINMVSKALQEQLERKEREKQKQEEIEKTIELQKKAAEEARLAAEEEAKEAAKQEEKKEKGKGKPPPKEKPKDKGKGKGKDKGKDENEIPTVDDVVEKYKAMDEQMIKEVDWKNASKNVPFEIHVELIKACFSAELYDKVDKLTESAYIRLKYRRFEVPYVTSVDIIASIQKEPIVPNGYDILPEDLNMLHLKQELTKLRALQKSLTISDSPQKSTDPKKKKKEEKKKEEKKKEEKKKEEKKKGGKKDEKAESKPPEEDKQEIATEYELSQVKHTYVRLIIERDRAPVNAVCGLTVLFSDPEAGIATDEKETAVVIPLQIEGQEIPSRLPFVIFKRTANALKDEDEQLSLITDVKCMVSKDPYLPTPTGYIKIPIDLRENPQELIGLGTREYIYLAYKTEKEFRLAERDLEIVKNLLELERSFIDSKSDKYNELSKGKRDLCLLFAMEQLSLLCSILRDAIMGPIGDLYLVERQGMLFDIVCHVWKKYAEPVVKSIDYMNELEAHGQLLEYILKDIHPLSQELIRSLSGVLLSSHRILNKLKMVDPLLYAEISLDTGEYCEKLNDYRTAIQVLRASASKIIEWRENTMKIGVNGKENWISPMYITCNNHYIDDIEKKLQKSIEDWTDTVLKEERQRKRKAEHKVLLEPDEADDEFFDIKGITVSNNEPEKKEEELKQEKLLSRIKNHRRRYYSDLEGLLASLHCDILVCLYRNELKLGRIMEGVMLQTTKLLTQNKIEAPDVTKGISTTVKMKMAIGNGVTAKKIKSNQKYLETTLHEAGKLRISLILK